MADTNLLIRAMTGDDPRQARTAEAEFERADHIILTLPTLCELCWVLTRQYDLPESDLAAAIRELLKQPKIVAERAIVEAGLAMLDAGGDFADGVIAHEGRSLGGDTFVSFDRKAVRLLVAQGQAARVPNGS